MNSNMVNLSSLVFLYTYHFLFVSDLTILACFSPPHTQKKPHLRSACFVSTRAVLLADEFLVVHGMMISRFIL